MNLENRARKLNNLEFNKVQTTKIIYVMSRDQRVEDNHALLYAQALGEVVVLFNVYSKVPNRIYQQYEFMLLGLKQVQMELSKFNIPLVVSTGKAIDNLRKIEAIIKPSAFVFDFSPLKGPRGLKNAFANISKTPIFEVDTHNIIPVWIASDKEEYGAYTLRPKIYKNLQTWLVEPDKLRHQDQETALSLENIIGNSLTDNIYLNPKIEEWNHILKTISALKIDGYIPIVKPGFKEANRILNDFLQNKIQHYAEKRNNPTIEFQSNLSAYLHFGQISSLRIVLETQKLINKTFGKNLDLDYYKNKAGVAHEANLEDSIYSFIEEIVVRKELAENYCFYNAKYDQLEGAKDWALKSHIKHYKDKREFLYAFTELEQAQTHDDAWNTAQKELLTKGKMHGYMRMYWAKKILEWTENPRQALNFTIKLNDKYSLDGYDPNGYAGIMWSLNGLHDRPWFERPIFGQIRYMNYEGLKKKFNLKRYINTSIKLQHEAPVKSVTY